jgi:hypothetical protein
VSRLTAGNRPFAVDRAKRDKRPTTTFDDEEEGGGTLPAGDTAGSRTNAG